MFEIDLTDFELNEDEFWNEYQQDLEFADWSESDNFDEYEYANDQVG
ncbi:hypothetical protein [Photobacterium gaetbulicola]|nr:hypothetical protein [Photobacterium gaetbulicola]